MKHEPVWFGPPAMPWDRRVWKGGSSSAPAPDPMIGQAAMKEAETGARMADIAEETITWNKARYDEIAPMLKELQGQQVEVGKRGLDRDAFFWDKYKTIYSPNEDKYAAAVDAYDTPERRDAEAARAAAGINAGFAQEEQNLGTTASRYGFKVRDTDIAKMGIARGASTATAANEARRSTEMTGLALREGMVGIGRGTASMAAQNSSQALQGSGAAQAGIASETASRNAGVASGYPWYSGAANSYGNAGQIALGGYNANLNAWNAQQRMENESSSGIGALAGTVVGGVAGFYLGGPAGAAAGASAGGQLGKQLG